MGRFSYSRMPKGVIFMKGQCSFLNDDERKVWVDDFITFARQKLEMTKRWDKKNGIMANVELLTPAEVDRLVSAINVKTYWYRADRNAQNKRSLIAYAKALLESYNRLIDQFLEGKIREEKKLTMQEIFNERK